MDFTFSMPTQVIFGRDCIHKEPGYLASFGKKAFIVTGKSSSKENGSERDIRSSLRKFHISYEIFDDVEPNPSVETVRKAAHQARVFGAEFIIGIGGGSPIDAAKAIAVLVKNDVSNDTLFSGDFEKPILPIVAVPTTAGTGSEVTPYSILTDKDSENKKNLSTVGIFPKLAYCDSRYTDDLPEHITINTGIDALSHSIEGFLSKRATTMSRFIALESIEILGECLNQLAMGTDQDGKLRDKLLYGSTLGGMVIAQTGTTALHAMGYPLTYFKNIDHGRANGLLMYEYLRFVSEGNSEGVESILKAMKLKDLNSLKVLLSKLLGEMESLTLEEIKKFTGIALEASNVQKTHPIPGSEEIEEIFSSTFITN